MNPFLIDDKLYPGYRTTDNQIWDLDAFGNFSGGEAERDGYTYLIVAGKSKYTTSTVSAYFDTIQNRDFFFEELIKRVSLPSTKTEYFPA